MASTYWLWLVVAWRWVRLEARPVAIQCRVHDPVWQALSNCTLLVLQNPASLPFWCIE